MSSRWPLLPGRMLTGILLFTGATETARSAGVCKIWKSHFLLDDRLWRMWYELDFEAKTAESKAIAVNGKDTPWMVRYKRRAQTEANWQAGRFRMSSHYLRPGGRVAPWSMAV